MFAECFTTDEDMKRSWVGNLLRDVARSRGAHERAFYRFVGHGVMQAVGQFNLPFELTRERMEKTLTTSEFLMTWKCDGVRAAMVIVDGRVWFYNPRVRLQDSSAQGVMMFKCVDGSVKFSKSITETLLDGELVMDQRTGKYDYLVHDVLFYQGMCLLGQTFLARNHVRMSMLRHPESRALLRSDSMRVLAKEYLYFGHEEWDWRNRENELVFQCHHPESDRHDYDAKLCRTPQRYRGYDCTEQHYNCDGWIFVDMRAPYVCGKDPRLLKWKTEHTVDVLVKRPPPPSENRDQELHYFAEDGPNLVRVWVQKLQSGGGDEDDQEEKQLAKEVFDQLEGKIVEFQIRTLKQRDDDDDKKEWAPEWHPKLIRTDKTHPNYVGVIEDCLEAEKNHVDLMEVVRVVYKQNRAVWLESMSEK